MAKEITLTQKKVAIVDDEDFEFLNQWKWHAWRGGRTFYAIRSFYPKRKRNEKRRQIVIRMHREILGTPKGKKADHKDRNGLNNRRYNLRVATHAQNMANMRVPITNTSGFKGVSWHSAARKWCASIRSKNKSKWIGLFESKEAAARAYDLKARALRGDFASLNF